jgi:hypothetical protein
MVRAVKTKTSRSLTKGQRAVLFPGPTTAEPWEVWVLGGSDGPQLIQNCATPLENRIRKGTTLALPVSQVFCLPLWLNETDPKQFAGIIPLQLELRGLLPRVNATPVFDWSVVAQEESRTLVMVGVLPGTLAPELQAEAFEAFDLSARYLPFPPDALTIWREQDRLMIAITRGPHLVYYQALGEGTITSRILQDLSCAQVTLTMQQILTPLHKVMLWTDINSDELTTLQEALHIAVYWEERPDPVEPKQPWKLIPATVNEARRARESQRWLRRGLLIFLAVYLLAVGWIITQYVLTSLRVADLRQWQAANAQPLAEVQAGQATWNELGPVVDTNNYPLELLFHAAQSIPADQLHMTLFESNGNHILIKGEAKNVAGAFQFLSKLKGDPFFSSYTLEMGNPRPLPNDLASFQIDGNRGAGSP